MKVLGSRQVRALTRILRIMDREAAAYERYVALRDRCSEERVRARSEYGVDLNGYAIYKDRVNGQVRRWYCMPTCVFLSPGIRESAAVTRDGRLYAVLGKVYLVESGGGL